MELLESELKVLRDLLFLNYYQLRYFEDMGISANCLLGLYLKCNEEIKKRDKGV